MDNDGEKDEIVSARVRKAAAILILMVWLVVDVGDGRGVGVCC